MKNRRTNRAPSVLLGIVLGLFLVLVCGVDVQAQVVPDAPQARIIGGSKAPEGQYPWMAALVFHFEQNAFFGQFCGGVLIDESWVLTSAHCVFDFFFSSTPHIDVVVGRQDLTSSEGERIPVSEIVMHQQYNPETLENDIAALHLSNPSSVTPLSMWVEPETEDDLAPPGTDAVIMGWGAVQNEQTLGRYTRDLMYATVPIVPNDVCNVTYFGQVKDTMLCAGFVAGEKDACEGDSGGPLVVFDRLRNEYVLAGIVSWGVGCALPEYYGVYTRVSSYSDWIAAVLNREIRKYPDDDRDGVVNDWDECPDTPVGSAVFANGCPSDKGAGCDLYDESSDMLHAPCLNVDGKMYWGDFDVFSVDDRVFLELKNFGER